MFLIKIVYEFLKDIREYENNPRFNDEVKVIDNNLTQLFAICKKPKRFTEAEYKKALDIEFNMEYPNGYKHNKHEMIVGSILKELRNG